MSDPLRIQFDAGTLSFQGGSVAFFEQLPSCQLDPRTSTYRAEARHYRAIVEKLRSEKSISSTRPAPISRSIAS
jgi:hypothetical protein